MARSITAVSSNSSRNKGVLLLAVVFGILSAVLIFAFLKTKDDSSTTVNEAINAGAGAESALVVTRDVGVGEKITSDMLTTRTVPASALLTGHFTKAEDVLGKVATAPIFTGEQVIAAKVSTFEGQTTIAYKVPEGKRALGLMVPHEGWIVGGLPQPGDRVDIVGITSLKTTDPLTGKEKLDLVTGIIAQDVEVLAMAQTLVKRIPNLDTKDSGSSASSDTAAASTTTGSADTSTKEGEKVDDGTYEKAISVTLALSPEQSAKIALIDAMQDSDGQYRIIVRRTGEDAPVEGNLTWTLDDVFAPKQK
ncbi:MAG TPA: Flp pilus assembly protein CpaB [Tepidiformaceae bacterium]|nr:Flp pilus assembly protein CpaB [Tepidiformaceae bacterium]